MQFILTINTDSAAFDGNNRDHEISRILRDVADKIEEKGGNFNEKLRDFNGNICGSIAGYNNDT